MNLFLSFVWYGFETIAQSLKARLSLFMPLRDDRDRLHAFHLFSVANPKGE